MTESSPEARADEKLRYCPTCNRQRTVSVAIDKPFVSVVCEHCGFVHSVKELREVR